jgi:hypothetical protein
MDNTHRESDMKKHFGTVAGTMLAALVILGPRVTAAQVLEEEPNNACETAQAVGALSGLPTVVAGSLDIDYGGENPTYDVDYYAFEAGPGDRLRAELRGSGSGVGTLGDPFIGLFDSGCNLVAANDDSVLGLESRLDFEVPEDGVFILVASGCCDGEFTGNHGQEGSYELSVLDGPATIGSVSGRVVDADSGEPLSGYGPPYAFAELFRCGDAGCFEYAAFVPVEADGRFRVEIDNVGNPLEVGSYLVATRADGYQLTEAGPFAIGEAEDFDVGDIGLEPPALVFASVAPCSDLAAAGGICRYSVVVRNNTNRAIRGLGWSNIQASGTGSPLGYSFFQAQREQFVRIPPRGTATMTFSFDVPGGVAEGAYFCADGWLSDRETAFMGTLHNEFLFCVSKQQGTFRELSPKAARTMLKAHGRLGTPAAGL